MLGGQLGGPILQGQPYSRVQLPCALHHHLSSDALTFIDQQDRGAEPSW